MTDVSATFADLERIAHADNPALSDRRGPMEEPP